MFRKNCFEIWIFTNSPFVFQIFKSSNFSKRQKHLTYSTKNNTRVYEMCNFTKIQSWEHCITKIAQFIWEFIWIYSHGFYVAQKRVTYLVPTTMPWSCKIKGAWCEWLCDKMVLHCTMVPPKNHATYQLVRRVFSLARVMFTCHEVFPDFGKMRPSDVILPITIWIF